MIRTQTKTPAPPVQPPANSTTTVPPGPEYEADLNVVMTAGVHFSMRVIREIQRRRQSLPPADAIRAASLVFHESMEFFTQELTDRVHRKLFPGERR
jgi:hypothetical protein